MTKQRHASSGFTLLEVLVASAVLGMVMVILLGSVTTSLSIWRNTEANMAADREGRSAFQILAADLANAVVPTNPAMWPASVSNGTVLRFLTLKPADYQNAAGGDTGDVCFVEYTVRSNALLRAFVGSSATFSALSAGAFPSAPTPQLLATNIISNTIALKRTAIMRSTIPADISAVRTNFTLLRLTNNSYTNATAGVRPDAVQVSISAVDMDALRNTNLLNNTNIPLRGGGFYTFTVNLPSAP